ncbi:HAD family phosphatase [Microbispora sp. RL4-1S]|uniref:HAD family phosphatase n=2 Tax=Microbispora oryzae TaxID=2806554 RepID=A0A941ARG0_9ACTN|nr:HAD family phosphatase [Microbispora oryzae]
MRTALFDLDGTLVNTERRSLAMWRLLLENHGFEPDETLVRRFMGRRGRDVLPEIMPDGDVTALLAEVFSYDELPGLPGIEPVPGAAELVRRIAGSGSPLGLVTSAHRAWALERLAALQVAELVRTIVSAEDVVVGKPDPSGYLAAADRLGVDPVTCVVFEDSLAGIAAAKAAGMTCVAVATTHDETELSHADLVVPDLSGVDWPLTDLRLV